MELAGVRLRRKPLEEVVQRLDAFAKVPENVQEEKKAYGGAISLISFALISWLVIGEIRWYFDSDYQYKFLVDTEYNASLTLDIDLVVAMSCDLIGADIVDSADQSVGLDRNKKLQMTPTKFDLSPSERKYWNILQTAQKEQSRPGQSFKRLDNLLFVANNVLRGLRSAENEPMKNKQQDRGMDFMMHGSIRIISPDGGVMQILNLRRPEGAGACRIHGQIPVAKVGANLHITPGKTLSLGGGAHAHLNLFGSEQDYNFSHRIERFSLGPRVSGLVNPLAGTEKISDTHLDLYQYYLKVVPTKVYSAASSFGLLDSGIQTYQYSVTQKKREIQHSKGSHGIPGLNFKYELASTTIEVREERRSFIHLLIRLCAVVGGIFATSGIINSLVGLVWNLVTCGSISDPKHKPSATIYNQADAREL